MNKSQQFPFEYNVLMIACILGLLGSIITFIGGFDLAFNLAGLAFGILFSLTILALLMKLSFTWVLICFYLPFIGLLIYTFHVSEGLQQSIEYQIFVGLILIAFTLKGKLPLYFFTILILGVFGSIILIEIESGLIENFEDKHSSDLNFIFASLVAMGFTYYAKNILVKSRNELKQIKYELQLKNVELSEKKDQLEKKKDDLEKLSLTIDERVYQRTEDLNQQKERREKYLLITSSELNHNFEKTIASIGKIEFKKTEEHFSHMLKKSCESLKSEMNALKEKVGGHD